MALQSALAVGLEAMLRGMHISTLDDLADAVRDRAEPLAAYISSSSSRRVALAAVQAWERQRAQQAVNASPPMEKFVEVDVAEKMIDEALKMGDERIAQEVAARVAAEQRAEAAELLARQLESAMEMQTALLERAEERGASRECAAREAAEQCAANEQALRQAAEQLAANAEAAWLAAEQRAAAAEECAAAAEQWAAEAERRAAAAEARRQVGRGGRGGRGDRGVSRPPEPPEPPPPPAPPPPCANTRLDFSHPCHRGGA